MGGWSMGSGIGGMPRTHRASAGGGGGAQALKQAPPIEHQVMVSLKDL